MQWLTVAMATSMQASTSAIDGPHGIMWRTLGTVSILVTAVNMCLPEEAITEEYTRAITTAIRGFLRTAVIRTGMAWRPVPLGAMYWQ